jgi:group I intron endonuclease
MVKTGVYRIRNTVNNKCYIGSAIDIEYRWSRHVRSANAQKHRSIKFQRAWTKYGADAFVFEILEECSREQCIKREQHYLDSLLFASCNDIRFHRLGYNICRLAGSSLGVKRSKETKTKISLAKLGKPHSIETRAKNSGEGNANSKLTEAQVWIIKRLISYHVSQVSIADLFRVSQKTISNIKNNKIWKKTLAP